MGKHAKPRETVGARRAAALSAGTLTLCLWGAGTAIAGTGGALGTGPVPTPKVPEPIAQVVQKVSDTAGVPNPLATPAPQPTSDPAPAPKPKPVPHVQAPEPASPPHAPQPAAAPRRHAAAARQVLHSTPVATLLAVQPTHVHLAIAPISADGVVTGVLASGPTAGLTPRPWLPVTQNGTRAPHGLLLALAALVSGALAISHLQVAQRRIAHLPA